MKQEDCTRWFGQIENIFTKQTTNLSIYPQVSRHILKKIPQDMNCLAILGCGITPPIWSLINYTYQPPPPKDLSSPGIDSNASEQIKSTMFLGGKNMKFKKVSLHFSKQIHIFFETGGFFIWKKTGVCHSESFKSAFVSTKMGDVNYFLEKKLNGSRRFNKILSTCCVKIVGFKVTWNGNQN